MSITGLHHITLIAEDAQRTIDFYTGTLGLRLVKTTVNFDDPGSYHFYFGDETGSPGSIITFFIIPGARRGSSGIGGTHHYALTVHDGAALRKWKRYLTDRGVRVNGPLDRDYFESLYFRDPDGTVIELATRGPGMLIDEPAETLGTATLTPPAEKTRANRDHARIEADTHPEPVPRITKDMQLSSGMHHISAISSDVERTNSFLSDVLGLMLVKRQANFDSPDSAHWYWGVGTGESGGLITYFDMDPARTPPTRMGAGQTHHYAFSVPGDDELLAMGEKLRLAGYRTSPVMDRTYFRSIYSNDPDGHIVELATATPGFAVDEDPAGLGMELKLPAQLEPLRAQIMTQLPDIEIPSWPYHLEEN